MSHYITNTTQGDGFGSQYQHYISTILICYANGFQYVYNPLTKIEHNYDNQPDFIERIEALMNLKPFFLSLNDPSLVGERVINYDTISKYAMDNNIDLYTKPEYLAKIRDMFWANKDKNSIWTNGKTNVAVHIRRPNSHDSRIMGADTPDKYYLDLIDRIRREHSGKDLLFHIYSQGSPDLFQAYQSPDTVFHLDEDLCVSFTSMVAADILATSASSLSYIAAFLNEGIVYYMPFWHPKISHWIQV
jgi:hypothetical protein